MITIKKRSMVLGVVGAIASFGITSPVLAANRIIWSIEWANKTYEIDISIAGVERFAQTGDTSGLPPQFSYLNLSPDFQDYLRTQLNTPITSESSLPLHQLENLLALLLPTSTPELRKSALTLMMQKANGKTAINFLKALPVDTITADNFGAILNAYQGTKSTDPIRPITFSIGGISVPGQGQFSSVPGVTTIDFESGAPTSGPVIYSAPGSGPAIVSGNADSKYAAPYDDATKYLTVAPFGNELGNRPVTINFVNKLDYFGLHWGSFGSGNSISFYNDNTLVQSFSDTDIASMIGVGLGSDAYVNFFAESGEFFDKVVIDSSGIAFESDNHAYKSVPEPSSVLGLLAFGTFGVSSVLKRKRQQKVLNSVVSD